MGVQPKRVDYFKRNEITNFKDTTRVITTKNHNFHHWAENKKKSTDSIKHLLIINRFTTKKIQVRENPTLDWCQSFAIQPSTEHSMYSVDPERSPKNEQRNITSSKTYIRIKCHKVSPTRAHFTFGETINWRQEAKKLIEDIKKIKINHRDRSRQRLNRGHCWRSVAIATTPWDVHPDYQRDIITGENYSQQDSLKRSGARSLAQDRRWWRSNERQSSRSERISNHAWVPGVAMHRSLWLLEMEVNNWIVEYREYLHAGKTGWCCWWREWHRSW